MSSGSLRIERLNANDLATLASDRGPAPFNIAALLGFGGAPELGFETVRDGLEGRLSAVPRLRQRLRVLPRGLGRPIWIDDGGFDIRAHVQELALPQHRQSRDGRRVLLDLVGDFVCEPLPRSRPLWRAGWIPGLDGGPAALVVVLHHVVADGLGGLAALAALADASWGQPAGQPPRSDRWIPTPTPSAAALVADAWGSRLLALRHSGSSIARTHAGLGELGLTAHAPRLVSLTALNRPTGPRRAVSVAGVALSAVVDAAHAHGVTVNDIVLVAVGSALGRALARRGEAPEELVVSVPVSARSGTTPGRLGNETGVRPLAIPIKGDPFDRLMRVAAASRAAADRAEGARGASAAPLLTVFRGLARIGLLRWFVDHQRLVHTFVTNVRGPVDPLELLGQRVTEIVPVAISPGNVGVTFDVLSYAGGLVVTVVADPTIAPDHEQIADDLLSDLLRLSMSAA